MSAANRASLLILGAAAFMVNADARVVDPLLHIIADNFHSPVGDASVYVMSAYMLPYGLFQLFYGQMGDRIGKLRVMAMALTLFAFGTAACALVPNLYVFGLLRFLTGVVAAAIIPLSLAYIGDKFPYENRQAALGRFMSAIMLGQILSVSMGGIFGEYIGWRGVFILFGVVALLVSVGLWNEAKRFPEPQNTGRRLTLAPYIELFRKPAARLVIGTVFVEGALFFGGSGYLGASLKDRYDLDYVRIGLMLGGIGVGGLIYSVSVKWLVKRIGEIGILLLGGFCLFAGFLSISLMTNWHLFPLFAVILGMGFYTMHSTLQTKATELAPKARGTAVSLFAFGLFLGQASGVAALGQVVKMSGYPAAFAVASIGLLLLALLASVLFPRLPKAEA